MRSGRLWILLSGVVSLVFGVLIDTSSAAPTTTAECGGDVVVALDALVVARPGQERVSIPLPEPLGPGVWAVQVVSSDEGPGRELDRQPEEQWNLEIWDHTTLGPTTDLADGVASARSVDSLGTFVSTAGVEGVTVRHAAPLTPGAPNSVTAVCVGFTLLESPGDGLRAEATVDCASSTVRLRLANEGELPAEYDAVIGADSFSGTLAPGADIDLVAEIRSSTTNVLVTGSAGTVLDESLDTRCPATIDPEVPPPTTTTRPPPTTTAPAPAVTTTAPERTGPASPEATPRVSPRARIGVATFVDCAAEEVIVVLGNTGDIGATVDVALPRAEIKTGIRVGGGAVTSTTLAIGDLGDGRSEVRVSDGATGEMYVRADIVLDCVEPPRPSAVTVLDCAAGEVRVNLRNLGGGPARLTVLHERVALVAEVELAAGDDRVVRIALDGAESIPVRVVDAAGNDVVRTTVENICSPGPDPDGDGGPESGDGAGSASGGAAEGPEIVRRDCTSIDILAGSSPSADTFGITVELDGTVLVRGTATGDLRLPIVPGAPARIVVTEPGTGRPRQVIGADRQSCAEVEVTVVPDCAAAGAAVVIRRDGVGSERFVVLVDGRVAGVLTIDGTGSGTLPITVGAPFSELHVSRSMGGAVVVEGTLSCPRDGGAAGPTAAVVVVLAVLASAAGVLPWPRRGMLR